jgi:hypothetical protein
MHVIGNITTIAQTVDYTILDYVMGGHSSVTRGSGTSALYTPTDIPSAKGWANTGVGAGIVTSHGGNLTYKITTAATRLGWHIVGTTYPGVTCHAILTPDNGGSVASDDIALWLQPTNTSATNYVDVRIRFDATGSFQVYDAIAAANLLTVAQTFTPGSIIEVMFGVNADARLCAGWFKQQGTSIWISLSLTGGGALTSAAVAGTPWDVAWGNIGVGAAVSYWYLVESRVDTPFGDLSPLYAGQTTAQLLPIPACLAPDSNACPWWIVAGQVGVTFRGSPMSRGDLYTISSLSRTGFNRCLPSQVFTSPQMPYIAKAGSFPRTETAIFDQGAGYYSTVGETIGLAVVDSRYTLVSASWSYWTGAAWSTLVSLDMTANPFGTHVAWTRSSANSQDFFPNGANGLPRYFRQDELVTLGCAALITDTGGTQYLAPIVSNSEGQFSTTATVKQMRITVSSTPISGTLAALGTSTTATGSSGLKLIFSDAAVIGVQPNTAQQYYRLQWTTNTLDPIIGKLLPFNALLFGMPTTSGSTYSTVSMDQQTVYPSGITRGYRLARPRRTWKFPYKHVNYAAQSRYSGGMVVSSTGPGATPRAITGNTVDLAQAVMERVGQQWPILFIPQVSPNVDFSTPYTILGRDNFMWGTVGNEQNITLAMAQRYGVNNLGAFVADHEWEIKDAL